MWQFPVDCFPLQETADQNSVYIILTSPAKQLRPSCHIKVVSKLYQNRKVTKLKTNMATRKTKKKGHGVQIYLMFFWQTFEVISCFGSPER